MQQTDVLIIGAGGRAGARQAPGMIPRQAILRARMVCFAIRTALLVSLFIGSREGAQRAMDAQEIKTSGAPAWAASARILSATCEDMDRLADVRNRFGATVVLLYGVGQTSNGWCPRASYERIGQFIARAHDNDLKVVCYFDTTLAEEEFFKDAHCEWAQRDEAGQPIHYQPTHIRQHRYAFCFNSPWSEYVQRAAARYAELGADGVFLDNPDYYTFGGKKSCFCSYCQERFKKETGADIFQVPEGARVKWLGKCLGEHIGRVREAMTRAAPARPVVVTANVCGDGPIRSMRVLGPYLNVLFREAGGAGPHLRKRLERDRDEGSGKPLWVVLTMEWRSPAETARVLAEQIEDVLAVGACPMVWATLPSWDPKRPGFSEISIYSEPLLAGVVERFFSPRTGAGEGSRDAAASQEPSDSAVWAKVAEAHTVMWRDYIDPHTFQIYTYLDPQTLRPRLPSYADVAACKPSTGGWDTALENCALDGGSYLGGLLDRFAVTSKPEHAEEARKIYQGLKLIADAADRKGCIPRGVMPDGKTHYPESSVDQYTKYVYGLSRYFRSPVVTEAEKAEIRTIFEAVLKRLEADRFVILSDTGAPIRFGDLDALRPSRAERLLAIVLAGADVTADSHWREVYLQLREPRLKHCRGRGGEPWVLVQNQLAFYVLRHLETDPDIRKVYEAGSLEAAEACAPHLRLCAVSTGERDFVATAMNRLESALTLALTENREFIVPHLGAIKRVLVTYDYTRSIRGRHLFVNGVRPVECIAWSLARQGLLKPE